MAVRWSLFVGCAAVNTRDAELRVTGRSLRNMK